MTDELGLMLWTAVGGIAFGAALIHLSRTRKR